ncbi:hypothetical protein IC582_009655 [Cucumis melo]
MEEEDAAPTHFPVQDRFVLCLAVYRHLRGTYILRSTKGEFFGRLVFETLMSKRRIKDSPFLISSCPSFRPK